MKKAIDVAEIITLEEAAKRFGLTERTIQGWREKGMPVIKLDKYVRVYWPRILEWLITQEDTGDTE